MTSATEKLRRMLDERGVKTYHEQNYITWRDANDYQCFAFETYERPGLLRVHCNLTPEQAIAATLGSERIAELEAENERLRKAGYEIGYHDAMKAAKRGGTLTAEQVMGAFEDHVNMAFPRFVPDWQAIADELNAALGSEDTSRWAELFGTPERAARTLAGIVTADGCVDCALLDATCCRNKDAWLEWLRGDAE